MNIRLYLLVNSTISNMFFGSTSKNIIFFGRIFFVVTTIFCLTLGCHSKVNQKAKKEKIIDCDFKNLSNSYRLSHSWENDSTIQFSQKRIRYFNASKSNMATLPCYEYNIRLFQNLSAKYLNNISRFTNSPMECQAYCQGERYCRFFTFKVDTNQCWFFTDMVDYPRRKFKEEGYISGREYCETTHPVSKGGFKIQVYKPWLRFNDTFVWYDLPKMTSHAWENCRRTCSFNKNCTSFDYCFFTENNSSEVFQCYMKSNTLAETVIQTPNHCVKSVKQTCRLI